MAGRENQGLHIALISCVVLCVLFIGLTYYFWSQSADLNRQLSAAQDNLRTEQSAKSKAVMEAEDLKGWIGYAGATDIVTIRTDYVKDMLTYGNSLEKVQQTYRELPKHLMSAIHERHQRIADLSEQNRKLNADLENTRKQLTEQLAQAKQAQARSEAQTRQITTTFNKERDRLNTEKATLARRADEERTKREQDVAQRDSEIKDLSQQNQNLTNIATERQTQIEKLTRLSFDTPDGKITSVNPSTSTALINLGKADGLRTQITFSVFGVDVNNLAKSSPKGSVEVIRVLGEHLAEVRITDDSIDDPILSGDMIYTPVWDSQDALRFALLGKMDIDGDELDDRGIVKSMITLNNGRIDAEDVDGQMVGRLTRNTRYLILGESSADLDENADETGRQVRTQMINEAKALGVEEISLKEILKYMGYNGERRIIPLGKRARADDFKAKKFDPASTSRGS